ncbi:sugar ABC transporter ATP-binding protein [Comamonas composti]|uniref:sugar ABC transporter ATP-binding protein n=1 Tax=Comamonas composti TaxID=408558 RepID=UPI0004253269|nr:sugar ABC transporter ATP-binding protein [Comamonas composti]
MRSTLELRHISKRFSGVSALDDVCFDVRPGEVHALMGENGAGKSTLIKIMSGVHQPDAGELWMSGRPVHFSSPGDAARNGIATVHQELLLFPDLSVAENIAMGSPLRRSFLGTIDWPFIRQRARSLLEDLQCSDLDVDVPVRALSVANRQRVEIARALAQEPRVLIMDEPTAALSDADAQRLLDVVQRLRARGVAIIYVSHRMPEVYALADRITVLRDGRQVATLTAIGVQPNKLVALMVGRPVEQLYPQAHDSSRLPQVPRLELRGLCCGHRVRDLTFTLHAGEVIGIAGLIGAGRTELALTIFGITPATSGQLLVDGQPVSIRTPAQARDLGIAYVPEDRGQQGLIRSQGVRENFSLACLQQFANAGFVSTVAEAKAAQQAIERFGIRTRGLEQPVRHLSGGNQQKLVLAKWLATRPGIVILDEPTRGIDVGAKAEIYAHIRRLAQEGLAIVLISSDLPEVLGMSDRILVMSAGRITASFDRQQATAELVGEAMIHLGMPEAA